MCNDDLAALLDSLERWYPRPFLDALAAAWPDLEPVPEGRDVFAQYPVAGLPDGEELSRLVADANLTMEVSILTQR